MRQLETLSPAGRDAFILMDLICPPPVDGVLVRRGEVLRGPVVSELGIYGLWLSREEEEKEHSTSKTRVLMNEAGGHLLRTKLATSSEGGVAAGFAVLDSPLLV